MKKIFLLFFLLVVIALAYAAWSLMASATSFNEKSKYITIQENETNIEQVITKLKANNLINNSWSMLLANALSKNKNNAIAGKYEIKKGQNVREILNMIKTGKFAQVNLVINKLRLREDFAKLIAKNFPIDSADVYSFISNNDSIKNFGVDSNTFTTLIIPNTYTFYWNASVKNIIKKLADEKDIFWGKENRMDKAKTIGLNPAEVYALASIVEEESNYNDDRPNIASTYLNRLNKGMPLQADPTIKFAMKNFTLKRIYQKYLTIPSPFNTYVNKGLPIGPICTPSGKCIDIVLNAPKTDYLYFVANANFDGRHHFSNSYAEHLQYAKQYQQALDEYLRKKNNNNVEEN